MSVHWARVPVRRGFQAMLAEEGSVRCLCVGREFRFAGVFKLCSAEDVPTVTTSDVCVGREFWFARVFKLCLAEEVLIATISDVCAWGESFGSPEFSIHLGQRMC